MKLTKHEADVLCLLAEKPDLKQRDLSQSSGYSLGCVNQAMNSLCKKELLNQEKRLTHIAEQMLDENSPKQAVILAAGFGMRMVPINLTVPKALLEVHGERLIERQIRQLKEAGIEQITVIAGFMNEHFEYLIDDYGINLIVCGEYAVKNNLHTLSLASQYLENAYIVPCDLWFRENPFRKHELYSWYMVSDEMKTGSHVRVNRKRELVIKEDCHTGNHMIGVGYFTAEDGKKLEEKLKQMDAQEKYDHSFWEEALADNEKMLITARVFPKDNVTEINTYEQLRELDSGSAQLQSDAIRTICIALNVHEMDITDIEVLKKGMTNRSFMFTVQGQKYIMRIPGEGTDKLISRPQEARVYEAIRGKGLCDDPVYLNPGNGYKITKFLEDVRVCDPENEEDLTQCMTRLKEFHQMQLSVSHSFDIIGQIAFYESLREGEPSVYRDYEKTKENVLGLQKYIDSCQKDRCLAHIDAVPDNFLFYKENQTVQLQLTDWEYAGMQDPHVDIAMFCIYSLYGRGQIDHLIDLYFEGKCDRRTRIKIYCYIAECGLLWSNWCEYKRKLRVEFGEYSLRQYRYAKDYSRIAKTEMENI